MNTCEQSNLGKPLSVTPVSCVVMIEKSLSCPTNSDTKQLTMLQQLNTISFTSRGHLEVCLHIRPLRQLSEEPVHHRVDQSAISQIQPREQAEIINRDGSMIPN